MDQLSIKIARRRRGTALGEAILAAAWAELSSGGYRGFTVDAVAARAGTSKPVIYRRWPSKIQLASSAVTQYIKENPILVPDLGSVREELVFLLRRYADRTPPATTRLFFEMHEDMADVGDSFEHERFREDLLGDLIRRGLQRGEINGARITPRVLAAAPSLVLNEIMVTGREISDLAIMQIVDQVFLPIVQPQNPVSSDQ